MQKDQEININESLKIFRPSVELKLQKTIFEIIQNMDKDSFKRNLPHLMTLKDSPIYYVVLEKNFQFILEDINIKIRKEMI